MPERLKEVVVQDILSTKVGMSVKSVERIRRLARKAMRKQHPLIVRIYDCNDKMSVLHAAYMLKDI